MNSFTYSFLLLFLISSGICRSQVLKNPESVAFDKETNCYFVSNVGNGSIQKVDKNGTIQAFAEGFSSFLGIQIYNNIVYVAENVTSGDDFVRGFSKATGEEAFSFAIKDSKQLNDVEIDNKGNLYVSDRVGNKIYKLDVKKKTCSVLVDGSITTPNGLFFDEKKQKLLVCNTVEKCDVFEVDPESGKVELLVHTNYPHLDGITMDSKGILYLTSWSLDWKNSKLLSYAKGVFSEMQSNTNGMADIDFNLYTNKIDIACFYSNTIESVDLKEY